MSTFTLHHGDCLEVLRGLDADSIDAIVTDPPYGLAFMGKRWDYDVPSEDIWRECLRVLKPGGHLLAFAGTRTQHRMAVRIEDAGFEIRDMIAWVYGSGFPKSLDVSKAIDRKRDDREDVLRVTGEIARLRDIAGLSNRDLDDAFGFAGMAGHWTSTKSQPAVPTVEQWAVLRDMLNPDECLDAEVWRLNGRKGQPGEAWAEREVVGQSAHKSGIANGVQGHHTVGGTRAEHYNITAPATPEAQQWAGWGTALKPALEPITMARKPLEGTVAANVLAHGTGGINVDGCRVAHGDQIDGRWGNGTRPGGFGNVGAEKGGGEPCGQFNEAGRWPANLIHDGSDEVTDPLGEAARFFYCAKASKRDREEGCEGLAERNKRILGDGIPSAVNSDPRGMSGGGDRLARNVHPTVKPTDLMRYLCRLVTPPGGLVLDPFCGSGSTGKGALLEGFRFIGIEREEEYAEIARARIAAAVPEQQTLPL